MKPSPVQSSENLLPYASELTLHFMSVISNNYEKLRAENHAEALHDMRVATRRMRETIKLFEPLFPPARIRKIVSKVKKLTKALGLARETDVNLKLIRELKYSGGLVARAASEHLRAILEQEQFRIRQRMLLALEKTGLKSVREELTQLSHFSSPYPLRPLLIFEEQQVADRESFLKTIPGILAEKARLVCNFEMNPSSLGDDHALHLLRIATKKLRYAFEITKPLVLIPCDDLARECRTLQDAIGAHHDTYMLIECLQTQRAQLAKRNLTLLADGCRQLMADLVELKQGYIPRIELTFAVVKGKLVQELLKSEADAPETVLQDTSI
jgi:CHAD domain-containing protein